MNSIRFLRRACWLFILLPILGQAQSFEYLDKDTYLTPPKHIAGHFFLQGTPVKLNNDRAVLLGTLRDRTYLFPEGSKLSGYFFKAGTEVAFNNRGEVTRGTLEKEEYLIPSGSMSGQFFSPDCMITFNANGEVLRGVLSRKTYLFPQGAMSGLYFKPGCAIDFSSNGEVIRGVLNDRSYLFSKGSMSGKYYEAGTWIEFSNKEVVTAIPNKCDCEKSIFKLEIADQLQRLNDIINGVVTNYDKTVLNVLQRNNWSNCLAVVDVTSSMSPYVAQIYMWLRLNQSKNRTRYFVFFNDGDNKSQHLKVNGATGGLYGIQTKNLDVLLNTMAIAMKNGDGGDAPENDIEAMLHGINKCTDCTNIIHVADNNTSPRDIALLSRIRLPVHVIACGAKSGINPELLNIAYKTKGSFHTIEEDINDLASMSDGDIITIGGTTYILSGGSFRKTR
ncbi:MAG: hypothetical protein ACKO5C_02170 [Ferruginibacter sp.]